MKHRIEDAAFVAGLIGVLVAMVLVAIVTSPYWLTKSLYLSITGRKQESVFAKYEYHQM